MRNLFFAAFLFLMVSCSDSAETKTADGDTAKMTTAAVTYPYPIGYSSDFEMGNPEYSKMILSMWKDWDNNTLDNSAAYFADSVTMYFPGYTLAGKRDTIMAGAKQHRSTYDQVNSEVNAVMAVKSKDKNEDWVLVWGKEVTKDKSGKLDSIYLQETWRINKDGKIDLVYQFKSEPATNMK